MKKKKTGKVYFLSSIRKNGKRMTYTGSTTRSVGKRFSEHKKSIGKNKTWVGKGKNVGLIGSFFSKNPRKAEATIKRNRRKKFGLF